MSDERANIPLSDLVGVMLKEVQTGTGRCAKRGKSGHVTVKDHNRLQDLPDIPERIFKDISIELRFCSVRCKGCGSENFEVEGIFLKQRHERSHTTRWVLLEPGQIEAYSNLPKTRLLVEDILSSYCVGCWSQP